jgi:hypothetical protein
VSEIARLGLGLENSRIGKAEQNRITRVLTDLDWGLAPFAGGAGERKRCVRCCRALNIWHRSRYGFGRAERLRERDKHLDRVQAQLDATLPLRFNPAPKHWRGKAQLVSNSRRLTARDAWQTPHWREKANDWRAMASSSSSSSDARSAMKTTDQTESHAHSRACAWRTASARAD